VPILFRQEKEILYTVAGERRVEAAKKAGLAVIPAILVEGNHAEIALVENLLRQDLTAVEEAEALQSLMTEQGYTQEQLAGIIGKARTTITDILTLTRLPQEIRDECRGSGAVTRKTLIEIARKKQDRGMLTAWNKYKETLAKAAEGRKPRERVPETAEEVMKWLSKAASKLGGIDTSAWTEDEKAIFNQILMNLNESIQAILNPSDEPSNLA
jgi:ParB family chromosome partitioning protein